MILVDYAGQVTYTKRIELMRKPERVLNSLFVPPAWLSWLSLSGSREKKGKLIVVAIPTSQLRRTVFVQPAVRGHHGIMLCFSYRPIKEKLK
jgi:hypothetical protein